VPKLSLEPFFQGRASVHITLEKYGAGIILASAKKLHKLIKRSLETEGTPHCYRYLVVSAVRDESPQGQDGDKAGLIYDSPTARERHKKGAHFNNCIVAAPGSSPRHGHIFSTQFHSAEAPSQPLYPWYQ
jgi:hypothetical protein